MADDAINHGLLNNILADDLETVFWSEKLVGLWFYAIAHSLIEKGLKGAAPGRPKAIPLLELKVLRVHLSLYR